MMQVSLALVLALALAGCGDQRSVVSLLASYDSALAAEAVYLSSGNATPADATRLRALRLVAHDAVQAAVKADQATAPSLYAAAGLAVANLAAATQGK